MSTKNLLTISQFSERYPAFPQGGLRWKIFNAPNNGLQESGAIKRVGRRVYIDPDAFFDWIDSKQEQNPVASC